MFCYSFTELTPNLTVPIPPERSNLVLRLSTLAESILTWSFISINLPKKLISVFEADQNPSLRPGASWKEVILNQEIPKLFFEVSTAGIYRLRIILADANFFQQSVSVSAADFRDRNNRPSAFLSNF